MWWVKYTSTVAFIALLFAYGATLLVGWSWAGAVPFVEQTPAAQSSILSGSLAVLIIAAPIWLIHWIWASKTWVWESETAQWYLGFFTVISLGAAVVIGVQLAKGLLDLALGQGKDISGHWYFGATWSVVWSLAMWGYHGFTWLKYRERRSARTESASPPAPAPDVPR
jgi:hypothetical protein